MQTALPDPSDAELAGLRSHFCTQGVEVVLSDSGLASRADAYRPAVADRLAAADLVLITGGSPELLCERTVATPALAALRKASESGAVIAGCSAGAIVLGAGMPIGKGDDRRSIALWGWLPRTVVVPHFGNFDTKPWVQAFPHCSMLGIPNDAMALVRHGVALEIVGDRAVILQSDADVQTLGPDQHAVL
jgi:cyanophycinase-like exopeptidase